MDPIYVSLIALMAFGTGAAAGGSVAFVRGASATALRIRLDEAEVLLRAIRDALRNGINKHGLAVLLDGYFSDDAPPHGDVPLLPADLVIPPPEVRRDF